jgi:putative MATE family efflux protein
MVLLKASKPCHKSKLLRIKMSTAVFTTGSTMRHVLIMTSTSAIGLMAIFFVDAISLYYISLLNDTAQTAAVGRASYIIAFIIGISIGMMIGASVIVARALGAGKEEQAYSYAGTAIIASFIINAIIATILLILLDPLLALLNTKGNALIHAKTYLNIILPTTPFFGIGVVAMGILRAKGDAKRAMFITLAGGILVAVLDPIFIFTLGLEIKGAAIVVAIVRVGFAFLGLYFLIGIHNMILWPNISRFFADLKKLLTFALPAIFTNIASPFGAFLIAQAITSYGDEAIAGQAVVDRLIPIAFGVIFALSGAVGPIIGQNAGAGNMARVRQTLIDGIKFNIIYVLFAWALLYLGRNVIINIYSATGDMALMINLFTTIVAASFLFNGLLFITNAAFNNLGHPLWATALNWARQTLGVLPFIWVGAYYGDLKGIAWGAAIGSIPFALLAVYMAFGLIKKLSIDAEESNPPQETNITKQPT